MEVSQQKPFTLPAYCDELRERARTLAAAIEHRAPQADESASIDQIMRKALSESRLCEVVVPKRFGGQFDSVNALAVTVIREVLAGTSSHLDSLFAMQGIGSHALALEGEYSLREYWLSKVSRCESIPALALTEPEVGSDLRSISTTVQERDGNMVINGHKSFITNAGNADFYTVLGREGDGFSLVLVPAHTDGLTISRPVQVMAPHVLGDVILENVVVPTSHRIGEPGQGFPLVLATLATFRVSVAGAAVGVAQAALDEAVIHCGDRKQFGRPLIAIGAVSQSLALSWTEIEMARSLTYRAAALCVDDPVTSLTLSSMAKVAATEVCGRVVDRAVQVMGRFGVVRGSNIERLYRQSRLMRIYEGSTEVILDSLGKQLAKKSMLVKHDN